VRTAGNLLLHPHHGQGRVRTDSGDIFDYLLAVLPEFGLSVYQKPSGADLDLRGGLVAVTGPH
jgi:hypothetical protein